MTLALLRRWYSRKTQKWIIEDDVAWSHAKKLGTVLKAGLAAEIKPNDFVPRGYEFIYFNSSDSEQDLDKDGYSSKQAPPGYSRRVWVGGKIVYNRENMLRLGEPSNCIERIDSVRKGLVTLDRTIFNSVDWSLTETRKLLYLRDRVDMKSLDATRIKVHESSLYDAYDHETSLCFSQTALFRFSALSFNAHKIHYDLQWAHNEGYPGLVVQGPLTVAAMMRFYESAKGEIYELSYRNRYPIFAGEDATMRIFGDRVWIVSNDTVCVEGKVKGA